MRIRHLIIAATIAVASTLNASEVITQYTLDQTLLNARNASSEGNYEEAFELYRKAARWGHKGAQYVVGEFYIQGKGVARDPVTGYAWLATAAEAQDRAFIKARNAAGKRLSESEMAKATGLAEQISAAYGLEASGVICKKETRPASHMKVVNCQHRKTPSGDLIVPEYEETLLPAS